MPWLYIDNATPSCFVERFLRCPQPFKPCIDLDRTNHVENQGDFVSRVKTETTGGVIWLVGV